MARPRRYAPRVRPLPFARWSGAAALLASTAACQPAVPPHTVDVPPRLADVRPPRSVAFVRWDVPLGGLRASIQGAIPEELSGSRKTRLLGIRELEVSWHLRRRPVSLRAERQGLVLEVALLGEIDVHGDGIKCAAADAGVVFHVDTSPTLRPGGELAFDHLRWQPRVQGNLVCGEIPVPLAPLLDKAVEPLAGALARGVEQLRIPLGPGLAAGLDAIRKPRPIRLGDKDAEACLDLDPSRFVLAPVGGAGGEMTLKLGVDVAPRVTLGKCSDEVGPAHAGALVAVVPLDDRFEVSAAVAVPHAELAARAARELVGKRFGEGGDAITLDGLSLGDASGRVLVEVPIHGKLNGTLYLWGTPTVTEQGGRFLLHVPDLQVALESRSLLQELLLVAWQLKDGGLPAMMRSKLTLDVTDRLAAARAALSGRHELGPPTNAVLTTELSRIAPGVATSIPGALVLSPVLGGRAELTLESRPRPE